MATIQQLRIVTFLFLLAFFVMVLPTPSAAQPSCQPDGDVDGNGIVTAADALLAFQQALGLAQLSACQQSTVDVFPMPTSPDGNITAADALCIFQKALGLPSCLDVMAPANQPPIVNAGMSQSVDAGMRVTLSGTASDPDGTIAAYAWEQTGGTTVLLSGAASATAIFTAPDVAMEEMLTFRLTVTDDDGAMASDNVSVAVTAPANQPPVVNAGMNQSVDAGMMVLLSGTASDADGIIAAYAWEQTGGTTVLLSGAASATAMFTAPDVSMDEMLTFKLTVTDDDGATASDDVSVTVMAQMGVDVTADLAGPVERGELPGLIVAVIDAQGEVTAAGAAGVRRHGSPEEMTVDDLFHLASCGKAMSTTTLAVLIDAGVFPNGWETTIAEVFPELEGVIQSAYNDVTLFQLVRMTGGVSDAHFDWDAHQDEPDDIARRYAVVRDLLASTPAGPLGQWQYANLSYLVAGAMAERLTGQSWETLMRTHLLDPLGMTTAGFGWPGTPGASDQPWAHPVDNMGAWTPRQPALPETLGPAGNVHLSVADWAKFIALWFPSRRPAILDRAALDELLVTDSPHYGAGWSVADFSGERVISHSGAGGGSGFSVTVKILTDRDIAFVAFANASSEHDPDTGQSRVFALLDSIFANLDVDLDMRDISDPHPLDFPLRAIHTAGNWGTNRAVVDAWNGSGRLARLIPSDYIEFLRDLYVNWVGLSVALHYDDSLDSTVERVYSDVGIPTFTDDALRQIIRELRLAGFRVYLTLVFEAHEAERSDRPVRRWQLGDPGNPETGVPFDDPNVFGRILPENWPWSPDHPDHQRFVAEFWETYTVQAVHFARIAEEEGVRLFSLGSETERLFRTRSGGHWPNHFRPQMEAMAGRVRDVFSGALTYNMQYGALTAPQFFGPGSDHLWEDLDLDIAGISAWFPLADSIPSSPLSLESLEESYEQIFRDYLIPLQQRNPDRPIVFLEYGAFDTIEAPADPRNGSLQGQPLVFSDMNGNGLDDGQETQANIIQALFNTMDTYPGVVNGAFLWDNWMASDDMWASWWADRHNFAIRGSLAEDVVRSAYEGYEGSATE